MYNVLEVCRTQPKLMTGCVCMCVCGPQPTNHLMCPVLCAVRLVCRFQLTSVFECCDVVSVPAVSVFAGVL